MRVQVKAQVVFGYQPTDVTEVTESFDVRSNLRRLSDCRLLAIESD